MSKTNGNIALIGLMGAGKTSVAQKIAALASMPLLDMDAEIEKTTKMTAAEIFACHGEKYFRRLEHELCQKIAGLHHTIISTGGGIVLDSRNICTLRKFATVFYLKASPAKLATNIRADNTRPLLANKDKPAALTVLLAQREPLYHQAAHHIVDTEYLDISAIAAKITHMFGGQAI
ncbi:MAG: shikimate kinase [Defluviitaleaceae bacterium]|nr:shikimate kinase [Defluviitaleaceae bacterium]